MKAIFKFYRICLKKSKNDLPEVAVLQQNLDSAQRKIGCLNLTKLESNFKPCSWKETGQTQLQDTFFCLSLLFKFVSH